MQPYKSQAYLKFGETIYMDRFLDGADPEKKARAKEIQIDLTTCRDRIQALTQGKVRVLLSPFSIRQGPTVSCDYTVRTIQRLTGEHRGFP